MDMKEPWNITVVRVQGLHFMCREKSWRPVITVDIDKHHNHEVTLGSDGQNPNSKQTFRFQEPNASARVDIRVWRRSRTKKRGKKGLLVAQATHTLAELIKRQQLDSKVEVRLHCKSCSTRSVSSRGRPQNGASVICRIIPPSDILPEDIAPTMEHMETNSGMLDDVSSGEDPVGTETKHFSHADIAQAPGQVLRRRRRLCGFTVHSDDEVYSTGDDQDSDILAFEEENALVSFEDDTSSTYEDSTTPSPGGTLFSLDYSRSWIAASFLPQYTEKIDTLPEYSRLETILSSFTMYSEMKNATHDSQFEKVFQRLQLEWTYIGGLLVALAAVDAGVFSISPGSIFSVGSYARIAIAASSVSSGLGIVCDAWFLLRYNWADLQVFMKRARDVFGSYFFFCLSARVPALCMFLSAFSLFGFLGLVAYSAWPEGVLVVCFLVGFLMTLQFFVFGAHWCLNKVVQGSRAGASGLANTIQRFTTFAKAGNL